MGVRTGGKRGRRETGLEGGWERVENGGRGGRKSE